MIPAKFLGRRGGTTANAIKAVDYLTDLKTRHGLNIVATNNSWGGGGFSQALLDAINRGGNAGILFIAAAGNGGSDGVGDNNDTTAQLSRRTTSAHRAASVRLRHRGGGDHQHRRAVELLELRRDHRGPRRAGLGDLLDGARQARTASAYASYSGTSMATPHVTGAAALYASTHPGATAAQIKAAILSAARPRLAGRPHRHRRPAQRQRLLTPETNWGPTPSTLQGYILQHLKHLRHPRHLARLHWL